MPFHLYVATFKQQMHNEYVSLLVRYSRDSYHGVLHRGLLLPKGGVPKVHMVTVVM